jgi:mannose-6-phosphate isomerase
MSLSPNLNFLLPNVKNYAWGKKGKESLVYYLWSQNLKSLNIENEINIKLGDEKLENVSFAELWFGTHITSDNIVLTNNGKGSHIPLRDFLVNHIDGDSNQSQNVLIGFTFIMKILSIGKPLSLQCHPDKRNAAYLHEKYPLLYPDANHKPEMGIVISNESEILCGFRPYEEFLTILNNVTYFIIFLCSQR